MAFDHHDDFTRRGEDRQYAFLTTRNLLAGLLGALALYNLTGWIGPLPWWLRYGLVLAGAGAGLLLTIRWSGLSVLDQGLLRLGLLVRHLTRRSRVQPFHDTVLPPPDGSRLVVLDEHGAVRVRALDPEEVAR